MIFDQLQKDFTESSPFSPGRSPLPEAWTPCPEEAVSVNSRRVLSGENDIRRDPFACSNLFAQQAHFLKERVGCAAPFSSCGAAAIPSHLPLAGPYRFRPQFHHRVFSPGKRQVTFSGEQVDQLFDLR
jgi:hypothetical protein